MTEMMVVLEEILATIPDYSIVGSDRIEWQGGSNTLGPAKLEVTFTPAGRVTCTNTS